MSAQHTPGPWTHRRMRTHFAIEAANGVRVADVAFVKRPDSSTSEDQARLIAAAPDLMAALKKAEEMLRLKGYTPAVLKVHGITTAIAKAEG